MEVTVILYTKEPYYIQRTLLHEQESRQTPAVEVKTLGQVRDVEVTVLDARGSKEEAPHSFAFGR